MGFAARNSPLVGADRGGARDDGGGEMQAIFLVDLKKVVRCVCKYGGEGGATIGVCPSPALPTKLCQLTGEYGSTNQKARRADFHGSVLNLCILPDFRRARWQR